MGEEILHSRRSVLKLGCQVGAAALAAMSTSGELFTSGIALAVSRGDSGHSFGPLVIFDAPQAALVHDFAEATLPYGEGLATVRDAQVVERLDEELTFVDTKIAHDFIRIIKAIEFLPKFLGWTSYFSELSREERLAFLNSTLDTETEDIRAALSAMRMAVCMMYYGHESTWEQIGYDGPFSPIPPKPGVQREHYAKLIGEKSSD